MRGKYGRRCGKEMVHKLKKIVIGILSVYVLVLVAIYITQFVLNQYGLEYRSCVEAFRVFWTYKLSFFAVAVLVFFIFLIQKEKRATLVPYYMDAYTDCLYYCQLVFVVGFGVGWFSGCFTRGNG